MTENHFSTVPGISAQKPLQEYTLAELKTEIEVYDNEIKARQITGAPDDWYSQFCVSWLEKCKDELKNRGHLDVWTKFKNTCAQAEEFEDHELCMQWRCKLTNGWCYFSKYKECEKKTSMANEWKQGELF